MEMATERSKGEDESGRKWRSQLPRWKREHRTAEYEEINPMKQVPAIVHEDLKLNESHSILMYIASAFLEVADHCPKSIRWPHVGRYKVDVAFFESVALPELQIKEDINLFVIDEVDKMELYNSSLLPVVLRIMNSNIPVLASIPIPKQGRDIFGVARVRNHPRAVTHTLDQSKRDTLRERI